MSSVKNRKQNEFNNLNQILYHPDKKDIKHGQKEQAKQETKNLNPKAHLNRYVAFMLVRLMINKKMTVKCSNHDKDDVTAKQCDTNTLALVRSLNSIKFITIINTKKSSNIKITIKITHLGEKYIQKYIPRYKKIYHYLAYGKKSMKKSAKKAKQSEKHANPAPVRNFHFLIMLVSFQIVLTFIYFLYRRLIPNLLHIIYDMMNNQSTRMQISSTITSPMLWISIAILVIIFIVSIIIYKNRSKIKLFNHKKIAKNAPNATRENFIKFLKINHVEEPDYHFGYNQDLPKIDCYLFNDKKGIK